MPTSELSTSEICFYRDEFRAARSAALADAEGFQKILFVIEAFGDRLHTGEKPGSLDQYRALIREWGRKHCDDGDAFDTRFEVLFDLVKDARNDAMHQGAIARHITTNAVTVAIALEDALMYKARTVGDFMVREVITAQPWHTLGHVRRAMLASSFSVLPMWYENKWVLVRDHDLAAFLCSTSKTARRAHMRMTLTEAAEAANPLRFACAKTCGEHESVSAALTVLKDQLLLLVCKSSPASEVDNQQSPQLEGIVTAYDLL